MTVDKLLAAQHMRVEARTIPLQEYVFMDAYARVFLASLQEVGQAVLVVSPTARENG
ncbi:hypothetical protein D3C75_1341960 [compost metagenome]